jgi:RNA polymerase sigma factor (sigma-70 family)
VRSNEELVEEIRNGVNVDANKVQLYKQNKGLIYKYIHKFKSPDDVFEDFEAEAYFAIEKAIEKYDEGRGSFNTCLGWWLMSVFRKYRLKTSGIPANVFEDAGRCNGAEKAIAGKKGNATLAELAEKTGLSVEKVKNAKRAILFVNASSLNAPVGEDLDELVNIIPDDSDNYEDVLETIAGKELWEILEKILDPREYDIIRQIYAERKTMKDVAAQYGVHWETVSRAHKRIIEKLKYNRDLYSFYLK